MRDSGPGVDPERRERVFDAFYTTKSDGIGMRLSICRSIIGAQGGRVWADANEPRGAVFQFNLPSAEGDSSILFGRLTKMESGTKTRQQKLLANGLAKAENRPPSERAWTSSSGLAATRIAGITHPASVACLWTFGPEANANDGA